MAHRLHGPASAGRRSGPGRLRMSRWRIALGAALALAVGGWLARDRAAGTARRFRTSSSPSVRLYDALAGLLLGGFYDRVAGEVAALAKGSSPDVLEVGPGPGHLAVRLARAIPGLRLVGLDIDPAMTELATRRAGREGIAERIEFAVGDVAVMPFDDEAFDLVVASFSAHHWTDPVAGLREILRVVRPGGRAIVYDLPDGWGRFETGAPPLAEVARDAGWESREVTSVAWPGRLAIIRRLVLDRPSG